jgi:hypothetical protein
MLHYNRWGYTPYETIGELAQDAINWFNNNLDKLDVNINKLADNTSISAIKTKEKYDVYNLLGNKVYKPKKGIYIKNKRKIIYH